MRIQAYVYIRALLYIYKDTCMCIYIYIYVERDINSTKLYYRLPVTYEMFCTSCAETDSSPPTVPKLINLSWVPWQNISAHPRRIANGLISCATTINHAKECSFGCSSCYSDAKLKVDSDDVTNCGLDS